MAAAAHGQWHLRAHASQDANKEPYPKGKVCITKECIENSIEGVNDGDNPAGTPVATTLASPFVIPIFIALIGLIGAIGSFCGGENVSALHTATIVPLTCSLSEQVATPPCPWNTVLHIHVPPLDVPMGWLALPSTFANDGCLPWH